MTMLYAHTHKGTLGPEFYALLIRVVHKHLDEGRLTGVMTSENEYVVLDDPQKLIDKELKTISGILEQPSKPFPYPVEFITAELLKAIQKLKVEEKKRDRATSAPPKPKAAKEIDQKEGRDTKAEKLVPKSGDQPPVQTPASSTPDKTNESPAA